MNTRHFKETLCKCKGQSFKEFLQKSLDEKSLKVLLSTLTTHFQNKIKYTNKYFFKKNHSGTIIKVPSTRNV